MVLALSTTHGIFFIRKNEPVHSPLLRRFAAFLRFCTFEPNPFLSALRFITGCLQVEAAGMTKARSIAKTPFFRESSTRRK
jgi:hypothetical protein